MSDLTEAKAAVQTVAAPPDARARPGERPENPAEELEKLESAPGFSPDLDHVRGAPLNAILGAAAAREPPDGDGVAPELLDARPRLTSARKSPRRPLKSLNRRPG